ncbi:MAG: LysR family transcriptional regulator [Halofilum sp. (in: g-proteobacteria)]|nr:LysR family transcriptional regulator [Halofilum sp. (in: g-proteobacteria)]
MTNPLSLDALEVLDAIDRCGSFAAAGEELHRVPSAISYTVQKLEERLDIEIFDRSHQRARLTAAGRHLLDHGRELLRASTALARDVREIERGWEPQLRIAVDALFPIHPLYPLIDRFHAEGGPTRLSVHEEVLGGTWEALRLGRAELVIGAASRPSLPDVRTRSIGEVESVFCCAPEHPLANAEQPVAPETIREHYAIAVADSSRASPPLTTGLLDDQLTLTVDSMSQKIEAQVAGLGVGFLPSHRIRDQLADGRLVTIELMTPRPTFTTWMGWRAGHEGRALEWFLRALDPPLPFSNLLGQNPASGP